MTDKQFEKLTKDHTIVWKGVIANIGILAMHLDMDDIKHLKYPTKDDLMLYWNRREHRIDDE